MSTQCHGFVERLGYLATNKYVKGEKKDGIRYSQTGWSVVNSFSKAKNSTSEQLIQSLKIGDILEWNPAHWCMVTKVDPDYKWFATLECNFQGQFNCLIFRGYRFAHSNPESTFGAAYPPEVPDKEQTNSLLDIDKYWGQLPSFDTMLNDGSEITLYRYYGDLQIPGPIKAISYIKYLHKTIELVSKGDYDKLIRLLVDGFELPTGSFDVRRGSTIVTLHPEYLDTLEPGEHTLTFEFTNGKSVATFYIEEPAADVDLPQTGDHSSLFIAFALLLSSMLGFTLLRRTRKA